MHPFVKVSLDFYFIFFLTFEWIEGQEIHINKDSPYVDLTGSNA